MARRVLLEHATPRADGAPSISCDRLVRQGRGYAIEWTCGEPWGVEHVSRYASLPEALADWYIHPRRGERKLGRVPPRARKEARAAAQ